MTTHRTRRHRSILQSGPAGASLADRRVCVHCRHGCLECCMVAPIVARELGGFFHAKCHALKYVTRASENPTDQLCGYCPAGASMISNTPAPEVPANRWFASCGSNAKAVTEDRSPVFGSSFQVTPPFALLTKPVPVRA